MAAQWPHASVSTLLFILKEKRIVELLSSSKRNETIYKDLVEELKSNGLHYTIKQVRAKVKSLKASWKMVRDNNNSSGKDRITCKFFEEMDELWGYRPTAQPYFHLCTFNEDAVNNNDANEALVAGQSILKSKEDKISSDNEATKLLLHTQEGGELLLSDSEPSESNRHSKKRTNDDESPNDDDTSECVMNKSGLIINAGASTSKKSDTVLSSPENSLDSSKKTNTNLGDSVSNTRKEQKFSKSENMLTKVLSQFREDAAEKQKIFIENEKRHQDDFLEKLLVFESAQIEKSQAHELKILELLMNAQKKI